MTKLLALETSTEACSVALLVDNEIIEHFEIAPRQHSELLLQMVDQLLSLSGLRLTQLAAIAVGIGPGSFMGVRLATGVAQGLAFAVSLPVVPVSSLQAIAEHAYQQHHSEHVLAAWDARMGEMYWGAYHLQQGLMMPIDGDHLSAPPAVQLPNRQQSWALAGNAWQIYYSDLPSVLRYEAHLIHPRASAIAALAEYYYAAGQILSPELVEPKYLRQKVAFRANSINKLEA